MAHSCAQTCICSQLQQATPKHTYHEVTIEKRTHLQQPVVGSPAGLKLQGAQGVGNVLQGIHQAVGVVIAGVDAPSITGVRVPGKLDSIGNEIPHYCHVILVVPSHPTPHQGSVFAL